MAGNPDWRDPDGNEGRKPVLKIAGLWVAGWLTGSLIPLLVYFLFFRLSNAVSGHTVSPGRVWAMAICGVLTAVLGSIAGASFYRQQALGIGAGIAATIAAVSMLTWYTTPNAAHWPQAVAVLLMAPAAQFAALARRVD